MRLLRLSEPERQAILQHGLTERHARALLTVTDDQLRKQLLQQACNQNWNVSQLEKRISQAEKEHAAPVKRTFIAKDIRLFLNTIDHAVQVMQHAGIPATREQIDENDVIEIRIRIPKASRSRKESA